jgi:hypothetical protein
LKSGGVLSADEIILGFVATYSDVIVRETIRVVRVFDDGRLFDGGGSGRECRGSSGEFARRIRSR